MKIYQLFLNEQSMLKTSNMQEILEMLECIKIAGDEVIIKVTIE